MNDTVLKHNFKFGEDNAMILTKTQIRLPLFDLGENNDDRIISRIDNMSNIKISGSGYNKEGRELLSFIVRNCFYINNRTLLINEDDFLNFKEIDVSNKPKYRGIVKSLLTKIGSTNITYSVGNVDYFCNFIDHFSYNNDSNDFKVVLGLSYCEIIIKDNFYIKYPIRVSSNIKGNLAGRVYEFIKTYNYLDYNIIQISNIRNACFYGDDLSKGKLKKTNEKIKRAMLQLEKLNLIGNLKINMSTSGRSKIETFGYSIVSQYKNKPVIEHNTDNKPEKPATKKDTDFEYKEFVPSLEYNPEALKDDILDLSIIDDDLPF